MTEPVAIPLERNHRGKPRKNPIRVYRDEVALVDAADADRVLAYRWTLHTARSGIYVKEVGHGGRFLHRFVLELPPWRESAEVVDHINHNGLDNRRANLRAVKNSFNLANSQGRRTAVHSLFKGVTYDISRSKWVAQIGVDGKHRGLGRFETEREAALAYNAAAFAAWGESAHLNDVEGK